MGAVAESVIQQCLASGDPLPEDIENAPELNDGLMFYLQAFNNLTTERHHGMGIMRIPWSRIEQYAHSEGLDSAERRDFHYIIRTVDDAFCEWLDKKAENERLQKPTAKR